MSCRSTKANSAITSYVRLRTGVSDKEVLEGFHAVRNHPCADPDPSPEAVTAHLKAVKAQVMADPNLTDKRKTSLVNRLDVFMADPDAPAVDAHTFHAWRNLEDHLRSQHGGQTTPDGTTITRQDVTAIATERAEFADQVRQERRDGTLASASELAAGGGTFRQREQGRSSALVSAQLAEREMSARRAYFQTEDGYRELRASAASDPNHPEHGPWREYVAMADADRAAASAAPAPAEEITGPSPARLTFAKDSAAEAYSTYETAVRESQMRPSAAATRRVEEAKTEARKARSAYLHVISESHDCTKAPDATVLRDPGFWTSMSSPHGVERDDLWRAAEHTASQGEARQVKAGLLTTTEMSRRQGARAAVRQSILDAEGSGAVDPANPRYAEMVRRQRAQQQAAAV